MIKRKNGMGKMKKHHLFLISLTVFFLFFISTLFAQNINTDLNGENVFIPNHLLSGIEYMGEGSNIYFYNSRLYQSFFNLHPGQSIYEEQGFPFRKGYKYILMNDTSDIFAYPSRKDPFIAGLLSWFMMGIGQIYCREYTKGSIFIAVDLLDKTSMVLLISYINNKYAPKSDEIIYINWKAFDNETKFLIITYLAAKIGIRFYSVIDAIQCANEYNQQYLRKEPEKSFSFNYNDNRIVISYTKSISNF